MGAPKARVLAALLLLAAAVAGGYALLSTRGGGGGPATAPPSDGVPARLEVDDGLLGGASVVALGPGDSSIRVYLFYDMYCPYCALEITESYRYLESLAGKYTVILAGLPVHRESIEPQAVVRCAAGKGAPVLEVLNWWYSSLLNGTDPGAEGLARMLSEKWGVDVGGSCVSAEEDNVLKVARAALSAGVEATPTVVVYDAAGGRVLGKLVGYHGLDELESFIEGAIASTGSG
ncbi:DsbA family protein [Stetteria hydrogenophila]